jgi:hypothetical protein
MQMSHNVNTCIASVVKPCRIFSPLFSSFSLSFVSCFFLIFPPVPLLCPYVLYVETAEAANDTSH